MFKKFFSLIKTFITSSVSAVNTNKILPLMLLRGGIVVIGEVLILSSKKINEKIKTATVICEAIMGIIWVCH